MISKNLSMKNNSKKKFVFLGDTDSINIEIIVRSHSYLRDKVKYIVIGNKLELEKYLKRLKTNIKINEILDPVSFKDYKKTSLIFLM